MQRHIIAAAVLIALANTAQADGDAKRGQKLFEECAACHATDRTAAQGVGPSLYGVVGRKAGEVADFRYSPALKRSNITWTERERDAYIADPQKRVPANRMPYSGMPDARDRADLIAYLVVTFK